MPRSGAGVYSLPAPPSPFVNGQTASATDVMTVLNDIATALTGSLAADGQTPLTGTLNANSNSITAVNAINAASLVTTAGLIVGDGITITKGGATVSAGGVTVTGNSTVTGTMAISDAVTVSKGGVTVTGNSTITGTLGGLTGLTVASGGATVTGNSTITGTLSGLTGLTVASGGAGVTGNSTVTGTLTVSGVTTAANGTTGTQVVNYSQFPATLSSAGSASLPSGLQLRWGNGSVGGAGTTAVTFSSSFSTGCLQVLVSPTYGGGTPGSVTVASGGYTTSGFNLGSSAALGYTYLAIGY